MTDELDWILLHYGGYCCGQVEASDVDKQFFEAKQAINAYILGEVMELIAANEQPVWESDHGFCNRCDWQPTDGSRTCLCKVRNQLRQELRNKANKKFGGK